MLVPVAIGVVNGADAARVVRGREVLPAEVGDREGRRHHVPQEWWSGGRGRGRGRGRDEERVERGRVWRDEREGEREIEER